MTVVEAGVPMLEQLAHPLTERAGQAPRGAPGPQAVPQPGGPLRGEAALQSLKLADAQLQGPRAVGIGDPPREGGLQQARPGHFLSAHREGLPYLHGMTLLLNSYGMTFL